MRAIVVFSFAAVSAVIAAEKDEKVVPITQTREETAISATKREFDTIKSSRDPAMQQKGDVPRLSVPEMPASSTGSGWTPPKANPQEKKPANWLVDAMENRGVEEKSRARDRLGPDRERPAAGRGSDDSAEDSSPNREPAPGAGAAREGDRKSPTSVAVNPFTRYLGDWMTPQDYALLKPNLAPSTANGLGREAGVGPVVPIPGVTPAGADALPGFPANPAPPIAAAKPKENPFLQALNSPIWAPNPAPSFVPHGNGAVIAPVPPAPVVSGPPPLPDGGAKSKVPDFVKPAQDEKYFKQLKRF